jgi:hypothetical protein
MAETTDCKSRLLRAVRKILRWNQIQRQAYSREPATSVIGIPDSSSYEPMVPMQLFLPIGAMSCGVERIFESSGSCRVDRREKEFAAFRDLSGRPAARHSNEAMDQLRLYSNYGR